MNPYNDPIRRASWNLGWRLGGLLAPPIVKLYRLYYMRKGLPR